MDHYTEADVRRLLPMADCVKLMRDVFQALAKGEAQNQVRRRLLLSNGAILHQMAGAYGAYFGVKIYSTHPEFGAEFTVLLYDAATGKQVAQFEANALGQLRTGAVSGAAVDLLAAPEADRIGMIGSGFQSVTQLEAVLCVRQIKEIRVWSRDVARRTRFADECSHRFGISVLPAGSAAEAVAEASIVLTSTSAREPVLSASAVAPGALVCAMGSNNASRRELAGDLIKAADMLVADSVAQCEIESGDYLLGLPEADKSWNDVVEFSSLVAGEKQYQYDSRKIIVFKSLGLGVEDIAAASFVHERGATPAQ